MANESFGSSPGTYSLDKSKIKFLLLEGVHEQAREIIRGHGYDQVELLRGALNGDDLAEALQGVHFLGIRSRTRVDAAAIAAADRLAAIGCFCIGTNQVDLRAAARAGVPVFNAPFSNTSSVAELALAEIIMLMRGIPGRNAAAHRGEWIKSAARSHEIRGKTLGIIGYGHIGSQLGILAESLGMHVLYHDIEHKLPLGNASSRARLGDLLREAQVMLRHPNYSGLQRNQVTHLFVPANFVNLLEVRQGAELLFSMEGGISISEDPTFRFRYTDSGQGEALEVHATDTDGRVFDASFPLGS